MSKIIYPCHSCKYHRYIRNGRGGCPDIDRIWDETQICVILQQELDDTKGYMNCPDYRREEE